MERKLYVSDEALKEKGISYFVGKTAEDYSNAQYGDYIKEDGLLISFDDMYDVHVQLTVDDNCFVDVEELKEVK